MHEDGEAVAPEGAAAASRRQHGHATEPRHRGVYHQHRQRGWNPHPHHDTARRLVRAQPRGDPAMAGAGALAGAVGGPASLHHHRHAVSARHLHAARRTAPLLEIGQIVAYDATAGTATVQLAGAPARLLGPIPLTACAPRDLALVGSSCLVTLLDLYNPSDGVVTAVWPAPGSAPTAKLTQAGMASVGVSGASAASLAVPFPSAYAGAPAVVATATDPAWAATVASITPSGFTLTLRAAAPATATVAVEWLACGV